MAAKQPCNNLAKKLNFDEIFRNFVNFREYEIIDFCEIPDQICEISAKLQLNFAKFSQNIRNIFSNSKNLTNM